MKNQVKGYDEKELRPLAKVSSDDNGADINAELVDNTLAIGAKKKKMKKKKKKKAGNEVL